MINDEKSVIKRHKHFCAKKRNTPVFPPTMTPITTPALALITVSASITLYILMGLHDAKTIRCQLLIYSHASGLSVLGTEPARKRQLSLGIIV